MSRRPLVLARSSLAILGGVGSALLVASCAEQFVTGPTAGVASLAVVDARTGATWRDTLLTGERRVVQLLALDAQGRSVDGARVRVEPGPGLPLALRHGVAADGSGGTALTAATELASGTRLLVTASTPGTGPLALALTASARGTPAGQVNGAPALARALRSTSVVAGLAVQGSVRDTTLATLGDTLTLAAIAFTRDAGDPASALTAVPGAAPQIRWTRRGRAVTIVDSAALAGGSGSPSARFVAAQPGVDTVVVTHPFCLAGARCSDTTLVRVRQAAQPVVLGGAVLRAWAFGDSVSLPVRVQDARGNPIVGASLAVVPLTAADSALVGIGAAAQVPAAAPPAFSRGAATLPTLTPPEQAKALAAAPHTVPHVAPHVAPDGASLVAPLVLTAGGAPRTIAAGPQASRDAVGPMATVGSLQSDATLLALPPVVARGNGTARVAVVARGPQGEALASDTISVVVRQVAQLVQVSPAYADLTPGDSIPVQVRALDRRGRLIADATFQPAMAGAVFRGGRIVIPTNAAPGTATLQAVVTGVAAPSAHVGAPVAEPRPDTAQVLVRVPPPMAAGDTTATDANTLGTTIRGRDGRPLAGAWVRFRIPAGTLQGPDSVQSDGNGAVVLRWTLPTQAGTYTATGVLLGASAAGDSAGTIVLRRTAIVTPGAPHALRVDSAPAAPVPFGGTFGARLAIIDRFGNVVPQAGIGVSVVADSAGIAQGFTLVGTTTVATDVFGHATYANLIASGAAGVRTLTFRSGVLTPASAGLTVTAPTATVPVLTPTVADRLPGGIVQLTVVSGGPGPYVWSVDGIDGGNATVGTVDTTGRYVAPSSARGQPAQICARVAALPSLSACASVAVTTTLAPGSDLVVINDVNVWGNPANDQFFDNLIDFTGTGPRAAGRSVLFFTPAGASHCGANCRASGMEVGALTNRVTALGYTPITDTLSLASIPADVKVAFVFTPSTAYPATWVNALKRFAAEGGRVVLVGEWDGYMGTIGIAAQNRMLQQLGALLTNVGTNILCIGAANAVPGHQIVGNVTQVDFACASAMIPGPTDLPLLRDPSMSAVVAAVAKIDLTPVPEVVPGPARSSLVLADTAVRPNDSTQVTIVPRDASGAPLAGPHVVRLTLDTIAASVGRVRVTTPDTANSDGSWTFWLRVQRWGTPVTIGAVIDGVPAQATARLTPLAGALTPGTALVAPGGRAVFNRLSFNTWTWGVNGVVGGNASLGTVGGGRNGVYVAPSLVPTPSTVEVCASGSSPVNRLCSSVTVVQPTTMTLTSPIDTLTSGQPEAQLVLDVRDAATRPVSPRGATWTSSDTTIAIVADSGYVVARASGSVVITANLAGLTASRALNVSLATAPQLNIVADTVAPTAALQLAVTSGGPGPFTWAVYGVGSAASRGTVSSTGLYTAPDAVRAQPVQVCAAPASAPMLETCATVAVTAPQASGDIVVLNDKDVFRVIGDASQNRFYEQLLWTFTGTGPRTTQSTTSWYNGHTLPNFASFANRGAPDDDVWDGLFFHIGARPYDTRSGTLTSIPAATKTMIVVAPDSLWSNAELNVLKQFAADGGRLVVVGDGTEFTANERRAVNVFLSRLNVGIQLTSACVNNSAGNVAVRALTGHQTSNLVGAIGTQCAGALSITDPRAMPIVRQASSGLPIAAVARMDLTPLP